MTTLNEARLEHATQLATPDPDALIREARRRQRRRRVIGLAALLLLAGIVVAVWQLAFTQPRQTKAAARPSTPVAFPATMTLHLRGWGTVVQGYAPDSDCPDGVTSIPIRSSAGGTIGSLRECDLVVSKSDTATGAVALTEANMVGTYRLPGGTIQTRERRTFRFAHDQIHTSASFSGHIVGGNGRYAHAKGWLFGGGPGDSGKANWTVIFHFR